MTFLFVAFSSLWFREDIRGTMVVNRNEHKERAMPNHVQRKRSSVATYTVGTTMMQKASKVLPSAFELFELVDC